MFSAAQLLERDVIRRDVQGLMRGIGTEHGMCVYVCECLFLTVAFGALLPRESSTFLGSAGFLSFRLFLSLSLSLFLSLSLSLSLALSRSLSLSLSLLLSFSLF